MLSLNRNEINTIQAHQFFYKLLYNSSKIFLKILEFIENNNSISNCWMFKALLHIILYKLPKSYFDYISTMNL